MALGSHPLDLRRKLLTQKGKGKGRRRFIMIISKREFWSEEKKKEKIDLGEKRQTLVQKLRKFLQGTFRKTKIKLKALITGVIPYNKMT